MCLYSYSLTGMDIRDSHVVGKKNYVGNFKISLTSQVWNSAELWPFFVFREDENDFLVQLCKSTGKLLKVMPNSRLYFSKKCCWMAVLSLWGLDVDWGHPLWLWCHASAFDYGSMTVNGLGSNLRWTARNIVLVQLWPEPGSITIPRDRGWDLGIVMFSYYQQS